MENSSVELRDNMSAEEKFLRWIGENFIGPISHSNILSQI